MIQEFEVIGEHPGVEEVKKRVESLEEERLRLVRELEQVQREGKKQEERFEQVLKLVEEEKEKSIRKLKKYEMNQKENEEEIEKLRQEIQDFRNNENTKADQERQISSKKDQETSSLLEKMKDSERSLLIKNQKLSKLLFLRKERERKLKSVINDFNDLKQDLIEQREQDINNYNKLWEKCTSLLKKSQTKSLTLKESCRKYNHLLTTFKDFHSETETFKSTLSDKLASAHTQNQKNLETYHQNISNPQSHPLASSISTHLETLKATATKNTQIHSQNSQLTKQLKSALVNCQNDLKISQNSRQTLSATVKQTRKDLLHLQDLTLKIKEELKQEFMGFDRKIEKFKSEKQDKVKKVLQEEKQILDEIEKVNLRVKQQNKKVEKEIREENRVIMENMRVQAAELGALQSVGIDFKGVEDKVDDLVKDLHKKKRVFEEKELHRIYQDG